MEEVSKFTTIMLTEVIKKTIANKLGTDAFDLTIDDLELGINELYDYNILLNPRIDVKCNVTVGVPISAIAKILKDRS